MKTEPVNQCSLRGEELTAYLLGELAGSAAEAVRRHVETCAACRERMRELQTTLDIARDALTDPVLASDIAAELSRDRRERVLRPPRRAGLFRVLESRWMIPAAAAAAILIGWAIHVWRFGHLSDSQIKTFELADSGKPSADRIADVSPLPPMTPLNETQLAAAPNEPPAAEPMPVAADMEVGVGGAGGGLPALAVAGRASDEAARISMARASLEGEKTVAVSAAEVAPAPAGSPASRAQTEGAGEAPAQIAGKREAMNVSVAAAERLARIRVPALSLEGLTARAAVEQLKALVAAAPGGEGFEIALAEAPTRGPVMFAGRAVREFRKDAAETPGPGADEELRARRSAVAANQQTTTITLDEAVRQLAEHYGLLFRLTDRGVEFLPRDTGDPR